MKSTVLKKVFIALAAFIAVFMLFSVTAFAEDYGNLSYSPVTPQNDEDFEPYNKIIGYNASDDATDTVAVIPSDIEDTPVTVISASAFNEKTSLTEVIIPDSVTTIENGAFYGCTSLKVVVIPDSVTTIGDSAFQGCTSLEYVVIGNSVKSIGALAFKDCTALAHIDLGTSVETINSGAFFGCEALANVYIPASVKNIGSLAFGFVQNGNTESIVSGFTFRTDANDALYGYNETYSTTEETSGVATSITAFPIQSNVTPCDSEAHSVDFVNIRKATDAYEGLDIAQCSACLAVVSRANTDVEEKETSVTDFIPLIIGVVLVLALVILIVYYIKNAKKSREKAIAEYKAGKTLSDMELKKKADAKAEAKYQKKRAKQEKRLEIFK